MGAGICNSGLQFPHKMANLRDLETQWRRQKGNVFLLWGQQKPIPILHLQSRFQMQWTTVLGWLREHAGKISFLTEFLSLEEIDVADRVHWKAKKIYISPKSHFLAALLGPSEEESRLWENLSAQRGVLLQLTLNHSLVLGCLHTWPQSHHVFP